AHASLIAALPQNAGQEAEVVRVVVNKQHIGSGHFGPPSGDQPTLQTGSVSLSCATPVLTERPAERCGRPPGARPGRPRGQKQDSDFLPTLPEAIAVVPWSNPQSRAGTSQNPHSGNARQGGEPACQESRGTGKVWRQSHRIRPPESLPGRAQRRWRSAQ